MMALSTVSIWFISPTNPFACYTLPTLSLLGFGRDTTKLFPLTKRKGRANTFCHLWGETVCLSKSNPPQISGGTCSILQSVLIGVPLQPHPACLLHYSPEISLNHIQFFFLMKWHLAKLTCLTVLNDRAKNTSISVTPVQLRRRTSEALKCPMVPPEGFKRSSFFFPLEFCPFPDLSWGRGM